MLKIGDFSRVTRVSVKALRHYDTIGLLRPEHVEPASGYRYYAASQVDRLQKILALKDLGFGLEEIRTLACLADGDARLARALARRRSELTQSIAAEREMLKRLDALARVAEGAGGVAAVVRAVPPVKAYTIRERVPALGVTVEELFEAAESTVGAARLRADASPFLIFHDGEFGETDADVEVCIPVVSGGSSIAGVRDVEPLPSAATLTFRGTYAQTPSLFTGLASWIIAGGYGIAGSLREVYHRFGANQRGYRLPRRMCTADSGEYITELPVPVSAVR